MATRVTQEEQWLIRSARGETMGPYTKQSIRDMMANRVISEHTLVKNVARDDLWRPVAQHMQDTQDAKLLPWFYLDPSSGDLEGPFSRDEMDRLLHTGTITLETRVRRVDFTDFLPFQELLKSKHKTSDKSSNEANGRIKTSTPHPERHDSVVPDDGAPAVKRKAQHEPSDKATKRVKTSTFQPAQPSSGPMDGRCAPPGTSRVGLDDFPKEPSYDAFQDQHVLRYEDFLLSEIGSEDWDDLPGKSDDPGWTPQDYDDWIDAREQEQAERE